MCDSLTIRAINQSDSLRVSFWPSVSLTIFNSKLQEEKIPPKPFVYEYGGVDYDGKAFAKTESQDEYGVVSGKQMFFFQKIN